MRGGGRYILPCSLIASTVTMGEDMEGGGETKNCLQRRQIKYIQSFHCFCKPNSFFDKRCFEGGVLGCSAMLSVFLFVCGGYVMAI
jgi:hypothetical protein